MNAIDNIDKYDTIIYLFFHFLSLDIAKKNTAECEQSTLSQPKSGLVMGMRVAFPLIIAMLATPKNVIADKAPDSEKTDMDNGDFVEKDENQHLESIAVNVKLVISSIDSLASKMRAILAIKPKLKNMSEAEKKRFIDIAKYCKLIEIVKFEKVLKKKSLTPEDEKFLQSHIQLMLNFMTSRLVLYRKELVSLLPIVQMINMVTPSEEGDALVEDILDCIERTNGVGK